MAEADVGADVGADAGGTRVVVDVAHPAHVHVFRHVAADLTAGGAEVRWLSRAKDSTVDLLDRLGIDHTVVSRAAARRGPVGDARELTVRVRAIRRELRAWRPQVLLTRNPSGVLAGLGTRTWTVFDTDDGRAVGRHYRLAAPFADVVTSSVHDPESHGPGHRRYPGLKAHAFLHPSRFRPDPTVRRRLGLPDGPLTVLRLSRHDASHDAGVRGIDAATTPRLLALLRTHGPVVVSVEGEPTRVVVRDGTDVTVPVDAFHDLLAAARLCVTDGQSVAAEAAVLGVPTVRLSGFTGRVWYLDHLERSGAVVNLSPGEDERLLALTAAHLAGDGAATPGLLASTPDAANVAGWFASLASDLAGRAKPPRPWPVRDVSASAPAARDAGPPPRASGAGGR